MPGVARRILAMCAATLWPGSWPPSPGLEPWAILISSCAARTRYSGVTPEGAEAVHGGGERLVGLRPQRPDRHRLGREAAEDRLDRLDLLDGDRRAVRA